MPADTQTADRRRAGTVLLVTVCAVHMISQYLRNTIGVIAPDLKADLGLDAGDLGLLSGAFFLSFGMAQIPVGMALDRFGARATMAALMLGTIAGCALFAVGGSLYELAAGRVLMGLGCSGLLMGPLALVGRWFQPARFAALTGLIVGVSSIGVLAATGPLAWAAAAFGWRLTFWAAAGLSAMAVAAILLIIRDAPPGHRFHSRPAMTLRENLAGVVEALGRPDTMPVFVMQLFAYSTIVSMVGLWAGPYLADIHGLDLKARGAVVLVLAASQIAGLLTISSADRLFNTRKWLVAVCAGIVASLLAILGLKPDMPLAAVIALFVVLGYFGGYSPMLLAHTRALFEDRIMSRGMTALNVGTIGGVFFVQSLTGHIVSRFADAQGHAGVAAYRACFLTLAAMLAMALMIYLRARDRKPGDET